MHVRPFVRIMIAKRLIKISITDSIPRISVHRNLVVISTQQILLESEITWFSRSF